MSEFKSVPIDDVRSYWDERPCNIRHSTQEIGSKKYFDEVEQRKYFVESHIPAFADFSRWRGKRVLEIGCGIGTDTINFARAGAAITAVELSEKSLEIAKQRALVYGLVNNIKFMLGNAEELDQVIPVEVYDMIYSFGVIHHTPQPEKVIRQIRKYMDTNSELRLMVYSKISYKLFWIMREEGIWDMSRMAELIARNSEAQTGCPVTYTYSFDEITSLLHGFTILEIHKAHIFTWDVEHYKRFEYKKDPAWIGVDEFQLKELEKELGWHTLVRAKLDAK